MKRYTGEEKAEIMQFVAENGVAKAKEQFGVSQQTVYKWKHADPDAIPAKRGRKPSAKKVEAAKALLADDGKLAAKLKQMESENAALRAENMELRELTVKLKKALTAFIG